MEKGDPLPPCEGRLVRAHLIDQQVLNRLRLEPGDPATYVRACGGQSGFAGHHGLFDHRRLVVSLAELPPATVTFAGRHNLTGWLMRRYR